MSKKLDKKKLIMLSLRYIDNMKLWKIGMCFGVSRTKIANDLREILDNIKQFIKKTLKVFTL